MSNTISEATKTLTDALNDDLNFRETYKANIAMCFYDEFAESELNNCGVNIHELSNKAADRFLNLWCNNKLK